MSTFLFSGCSTDVSYYKDQKPSLNLQQYLQGKIVGSGIIKDWRGRVTKQFDFVAEAAWNEGTTQDVIGTAKIFVDGNAMNWQYKMDIKVDDSTYRIKFDDWMYLMNDNTLINHNTFKKFGITVGTLVLFMHKSEEN